MAASSRAALLSGFLGATASCLAKLAFGGVSSSSVPIAAPMRAVQAHCCEALLFASKPEDPRRASIVWCNRIVELLFVRGICLLGMIVCNAYQLGSFLEGMETSGSVAGTALATASNFVTSAVYGYALWDETFTLLWYAGMAMVMAGVMLLSQSSSSSSSSKTTKVPPRDKQD